ncbi:transposase domain-containing protein [Micromonospora sp. 050-3]|uniref:transposase domain-containing protein n=1 Tax=Micromonospora sp. 050-3 TaxID=2789265 RepID=UPI00397C68A2
MVLFEMVDDVLATTGTTQTRIRGLPSRVAVYLLLAVGLFAESGYRQVWARLVSGLGGPAVAAQTSPALAQAPSPDWRHPDRWPCRRSRTVAGIRRCG